MKWCISLSKSMFTKREYKNKHSIEWLKLYLHLSASIFVERGYKMILPFNDLDDISLYKTLNECTLFSRLDIKWRLQFRRIRKDSSFTCKTKIPDSTCSWRTLDTCNWYSSKSTCNWGTLYKHAINIFQVQGKIFIHTYIQPRTSNSACNKRLCY